jgi:predicted O-methyltransferase YrrM
MNELIEEILTSKEVETPSGRKIPLHSAIDRDEGTLILDLFRKDRSVQKTLEVGCAYGLSSLFIAEGLKGRQNAKHTIIDPFQNADWEGVGVHNLKKSGFVDFELIEEKSEFALPAILKDREGSFDLIFIDGWHTLDHTLLDCFYSTRLLRVGGYLVVDDVSFPAISRVIDYLCSYPCFELESATPKPRATLKKRIARCFLGIVPCAIRKKVFSRSLLNRVNNGFRSMVALKKIASDDRRWDWFSGDF